MHIGLSSSIIELGDSMQKKRKSHILLAILIVSGILMSTNVYAGSCPLGPDVTKDLYGALKIIRIVAPLLVIIYSTLDTIKALTKGDGGAELKKVAQRFGKRAIYAIILFFLPMLINIFMQMADVWDANGNCMEEIENPGVTSGNPTITTQYDKCATIDNERGCNGTGGCNWSYGMCRMVGINGVVTRSPQQQCQDSGKTWSSSTNTCIEYDKCSTIGNKESCDRTGGCSWGYGMCRKLGINGAVTRSPQQQCQDSGKTWNATDNACY